MEAAAREWDREHEAEWARVDAKLRRIAARRAALDAEEANLLRYAEQVKLWRGCGFGSMIEYMERAMGYAPHTALERLRVARAIAELPMIAEALEKGELPHSAVRELSRVAIPESEGAWLEAARGKSLREIEAIEVDPVVAECAACAATCLGSLDAAVPERTTTTVTARKREQVLARDSYGCTVPGCRRNVGLDLHHVEYQSRGGGHELNNLITVCELHHKAIHFGRLTITGIAPDHLTFEFHEPRDRRSRVEEPPATVSPTGDEHPADNHARGPCGPSSDHNLGTSEWPRPREPVRRHGERCSVSMAAGPDG